MTWFSILNSDLILLMQIVLRVLILCILFTISVENETHCDFVKLREMLIRTNMEDMREVTHSKHYELYRKTRLEQVGILAFLFVNSLIPN